MQEEYGLIGGNIFHGELSLEQLFHMRPAPGYADYRTPDRRALQRQLRDPRAAAASAASPGWQAARAAIADRKRAAQRLRSRAGRRGP